MSENEQLSTLGQGPEEQDRGRDVESMSDTESMDRPPTPEQAVPELTEARLAEEAMAAHTEVDTEAAELVLQAEIQLTAGTERAELSAEDIRMVREEAGVDAVLNALGAEAAQLARTAKAEIDAAAGLEVANANRTDGEHVAGAEAEQAARLEQVRERLVHRPEESPSAYLFRAGQEITAFLSTNKLFDVNRVTEATLSEDAKGLISEAVRQVELALEAPIKPDRARNEEALKKIEGNIGVHGVAGKEDPHNTETFDKTQRSRMLFEIQPGKGSSKRETYWNTLVFAFNTAATRALAKKMLDGKSLLLLGGGRARLGEEMSQHNMAPENVLNADPFVEDVEPGADTVVPVSSADADLPARLREQGMEQADEIWAEYSVPAYLDTPEEISAMFQNIDTVLVEGGTARIWPLMVKRGSEKEVEARKAALQAALASLVERGDYELTVYEAAGRIGITLRKAKQEALPNPTE